MELTLYSLRKGEAKEEEKDHPGAETAEQALGISAKKLDLSKLDWNLDGSGDSKHPKLRTRRQAFQVQVSVSDLLFERALNLSPSAGMIEKGTHTITETEADAHTWGKLDLTRLDRPWLYNASEWNVESPCPCPCQNKDCRLNEMK